MSQCAPHFFSTFYQFSNRFLPTIQHIKNLSRLFFVSAKYCHFSLSAWSKMKNFDILHKTKSDYSKKMNDLHFIKNVKIFHF